MSPSKPTKPQQARDFAAQLRAMARPYISAAELLEWFAEQFERASIRAAETTASASQRREPVPSDLQQAAKMRQVQDAPRYESKVEQSVADLAAEVEELRRRVESAEADSVFDYSVDPRGST